MKLLIIIFLQGRSLRFSGYQIAYVFTGKVYLVFNESLSIHKILSAGFFWIFCNFLVPPVTINWILDKSYFFIPIGFLLVHSNSCSQLSNEWFHFCACATRSDVQSNRKRADDFWERRYPLRWEKMSYDGDDICCQNYLYVLAPIFLCVCTSFFI